MATLTEFLTGIADAIRAKKGTSGTIPAPNFAAEIESIQTGPDTSDATATAGDILSGKTAYGASGKLTGTIPTVEQATPRVYLSTDGMITASATQSAGYTDGGTKEATLQISVQEGKTVTPGTTEQTAVAPRKFTTGSVLVAGDANLLPENIKSGVSIFGVAGSVLPRNPCNLTINKLSSGSKEYFYRYDGAFVSTGTDSGTITYKTALKGGIVIVVSPRNKTVSISVGIKEVVSVSSSTQTLRTFTIRDDATITIS